MNSTTKTNCSNPFVFTYKTPFMQRIADMVRSGHTQFTMGTIPLNKAGFLAFKFEQMFHTGRSKLEACRARKNGESSARVLFLHHAEDEHLSWILLYQPGTVPDQSGQKWLDAITDKIVITNYQLVRHTRIGSKKPAWSWRYSPKQYGLLHNSIVQAIRAKRDTELVQLIGSISRSPGFALVREQVKKLKELVQSEWKRRRAKSETMPVLPHHGYSRRLVDRGCWLSELKTSISAKELRTAISVAPVMPGLSRRKPATGYHPTSA